jgi:cobalt/nickel transport system permease protein
VNPFPIDAYAYANRLHAAHPAEKMLFTGVVTAITLASGSPLVAALALLLVLVAVTWLAGIGLAAFWRFVRVPLGFILVGAITMTVSVVGEGEALMQVAAGAWRIGVTPAALQRSVSVLSVSLACVSATLFLALTTPLVDVAAQLRRWRVPALAIDLMLLTYRFIFVLVETAQAMHLAQEARLGYSSPGRSLSSAGALVSFLLGRALARADALFNSLTARGYAGELTVLEEEFVWSPRHASLIAAATFMLVAAAVAARVWGVWGT